MMGGGCQGDDRGEIPGSVRYMQGGEGARMIYVGCHLSVTEGYEAMGRKMSRFGGNTFAWFTRNPRGGKTKPVRREDVDALREDLGLQKYRIDLISDRLKEG